MPPFPHAFFRAILVASGGQAWLCDPPPQTGYSREGRDRRAADGGAMGAGAGSSWLPSSEPRQAVGAMPEWQLPPFSFLFGSPTSPCESPVIYLSLQGPDLVSLNTWVSAAHPYKCTSSVPTRHSGTIGSGRKSGHGEAPPAGCSRNLAIHHAGAVDGSL